MKNYLNCINEINSLIINGMVDIHETRKFSISDMRWASDKKSKHPSVNAKRGDVYQFDFGKNYNREMSYEHRGLVISKDNQLLRVLPIFSYDKNKHKDCVHLKDNPNSHSDLFLLKANEYSFISHDSVIRLNCLLTVSTARIIRKYQIGMNPKSQEFNTIVNLTFHKYFPDFFYNLSKIEAENAMLKEQIANMTTPNT